MYQQVCRSGQVLAAATKNKKNPQSGYVLVTLAFLLLALLAVTALAIDIGMAFGARTQNQAAADAAALAGAFTYIEPSNAQPATAQNQAIAAAIANKTMGTAVTAADVQAVGDAANRRVTVTITRTEPTFFSKVMGVNSIQVRTTAVAEASRNSVIGSCSKPFFVPNGMMGTSGACASCAAGEVLIGPDNEPTAFATSKKGQQFLIKPNRPSDALVPSNFYTIAVGGNPSGSDYRDAIGGCVDSAALQCGDSYATNTGDMRGPTRQGVDDLIGNPPTDHYVAIGDYTHADGLHYDTSRALVVAPIVDICAYPGFCPTEQFPSGFGPMLTVVGFGQFFIEGVDNQAGVTARLINVFGCGDGSQTVTGGGAFSLPIRLVRVQP
jgi:Flp pilus assembly protein TadG